VFDSTTNGIEHPDLVAQRIVRFAGVVGRDNVIAGSDRGDGGGRPARDARTLGTGRACAGAPAPD